MRILLRSDAGDATGTGHVMRCLTVAEELLDRGHEVAIHGAIDVPWLAVQMAELGIDHVSADADRLDVDGIAAGAWDAVVVDSYRIPAAQVSALARAVPVLAIIDGDDRGIEASWYVDPNLGADRVPHHDRLADRLSAGSAFALVRRSIVRLRREDRWLAKPRPRLLVVFGGSDPTGAALRLAPALVPLLDRVDTTVVVAPAWTTSIAARFQGLPARLIAPTPNLPDELDRADLVISAAGTSAWDVATLGGPAVFVAVVPNQRTGLHAILAAQVGLGVDASEHPERIAEAAALAAGLLRDDAARRALAERCLSTFDGRGAERVADLVEHVAGRS